MPRSTKGTGKREGGKASHSRHDFALGEQIDPTDETLTIMSERRKRGRGKGDASEKPVAAPDEHFEREMGEKILRQAKAQRLELEREAEPRRPSGTSFSVRQAVSVAKKRAEESDDESGEEGFDDDDAYVEDYDFDVTAEDERILQSFLNPSAGSLGTRNLADIIAEKLREREAMQSFEASMANQADGRPDFEAAGEAIGMDKKAVAVFRQVGEFLSRYKSGSIPKAFKIVPSLANWEEVLYITDYENWSVQAMFQATRLFASNLNAKMAQRFYSLVLLPRVRQEIYTNKKLHVALFQALKKAAYKPGAFYKGLLLPLCQSGDCTVLEAVIFSAVINRTSIPVLHSSAALLRLSEMRYSGVNSFFIKVLLEKKYALPHKVVDKVVDSFVAFEAEEKELPVVWHQSLLTLVQRYKHAMKTHDLLRLRKLAVKKGHYLIGPEVIREVDHSQAIQAKSGNRGGMAPYSNAAAWGGAILRATEDPKDFPPVLVMDED